MPITTRLVEAVAQPMIYVTTRSSMAPGDISQAVGDAFGTLGRFIAETSVSPVAPPLTIYRDWNGRLVTVDVGFPVAEVDAAKAHGPVHAGRTPAGAAVKTTHVGPYETLKDTYAELETAMAAQGLRMGDVSWEVYFNEPGKTPDKDLVTEIYMAVADAGSARAAV